MSVDGVTTCLLDAHRYTVDVMESQRPGDLLYPTRTPESTGHHDYVALARPTRAEYEKITKSVYNILRDDYAGLQAR